MDMVSGLLALLVSSGACAVTHHQAPGGVRVDVATCPMVYEAVEDDETPAPDPTEDEDGALGTHRPARRTAAPGFYPLGKNEELAPVDLPPRRAYR